MSRLKFKEKLVNKSNLMGTFVKTPSHIIIEVLAESSLDFIILDAEHCPFGREALDICTMTARLKNFPVIIRVPDDNPSNILNALDIGADGIAVPHIKTAEQARKVIQLAHYGRNGRGYAGSTRAASYGDIKIKDHIENSKKNTTIFLQIEDPEAVDNIDEISKVEGIDCLFVGRVDLTVAYGSTSFNDNVVTSAVDKICYAAAKNKIPTGIFLSDFTELDEFQKRETTVYCMASEHHMIKQGFRRLTNDDKWKKLK